MGGSITQIASGTMGYRLDGTKLTEEQAKERILNGQFNASISSTGVSFGALAGTIMYVSGKLPSAGGSGRTFKSKYDIPVDENGYTKSNLSLGQKVHREYKLNLVDGKNTVKEYRLPSGKRIDYIDFNTKTIYELKPNNPAQIKLGIQQLQGYLEEIESIFGKGWKTILDTY